MYVVDYRGWYTGKVSVQFSRMAGDTRNACIYVHTGNDGKQALGRFWGNHRLNKQELDWDQISGAFKMCDFNEELGWGKAWFPALVSSSGFRIFSQHTGAGVAQWLERWACDRKVTGFKERRENFLLQGQLSVLTCISVSVHPRVTAVARKRSRLFWGREYQVSQWAWDHKSCCTWE